MVSDNFSESVRVRLIRTRNLIEIEDLDVSVTFHPNDFDKTYGAIISKFKELYPDYVLTQMELRDIDVQLNEIYKDYDKDRDKHKISDAENLVYLTKSQIKEQFRDQTGAFHVVIDNDGHHETLNMDSDEFDGYLCRLYYESETKNRILTGYTINNSKRLLKSFANKTKTLYTRIAKIDDKIYYDLNNERWQCVEITIDGWKIIPSPMIFSRAGLDRKQVQPKLLPYEQSDQKTLSRRFIREIIDKFYIKEDYQKTIAEVYLISLFIGDIAHPLILPSGPRGSGKTLFLRSLKLIVDPRAENESLVERLPHDEKDRRVSIYHSYFPCFDNESHLDQDSMDEICAWVTGTSKTIRELYTTDGLRTFAAKRAIGITGINIPVTSSDALNRAFIVDMDSIPDGYDGTSESKLIGENKFINDIRQSLPNILAYVFNVLVQVLNLYDEIKDQIKPNHRLADFVIWGEAISRVIGNKDNVFLESWNRNTLQQNINVIQNNPLAGLLISYILNYCDQNDFHIEPTQLFGNLRRYALEKQIDVVHAKWFPQNPEWLSRKIRILKADLKAANILVDPDIRKEQRRLIYFKKITTHDASIDQYNA
jgi:hypothetical protein